jgi:hypothetical protein
MGSPKEKKKDNWALRIQYGIETVAVLDRTM